jgi:hypothetical protein
MASYIVVAALGFPLPCYIRVHPDTGLPCFTWNQPEPVSLEEARALKDRADRTCGGTLQIVRVKD